MTKRLDVASTFEFSNGAVGYREVGCFWPCAKVSNCPIDGTDLRLTCYATGAPATDLGGNIPAFTRFKRRRINGVLSVPDAGGCIFVPCASDRWFLTTSCNKAPTK